MATILQDYWKQTHMRFPIRARFPLLVRQAERMLRLLAWLWRRMLWRTTVIAVTGSVGKTTTKEWLGKMLASRFPTAVSFDTDNGRLGVPRSLLKIRPWHRYAVLEIAMGDVGDLAEQAALVKPGAALILCVQKVHIRQLGSLAAIQKEKEALAAAVGPKGWVVLNGSDPLVREMAGRCRARVIWFGSEDPNSFRAEEVSARWPARLSFRLCRNSSSWPLETRLVGEQWTASLLAAFTAADCCGIAPEEALRTAELIEPYRARMEPVQTPNGAWILRDEYNSSHVSWQAALRCLRETKPLRRWMVLSNVADVDLGSQQKSRLLARELLESADCVALVGMHRKQFRHHLLSQGFPAEHLFLFESCREAAPWLAAHLGEGDLAVLRGHTSHHLSRIIYALWGPVACRIDKCDRRCLCDFCGDLYRGGPKPSGPMKHYWRPIYY
jgi:UDP-N-acetylmuramoyl-tripeptide--D-alanyl-D-alanine ligase